MGIMAAAIVDEEGGGIDELDEARDAWVEEMATRAARRLKLNSASPAALLCEVENLVREAYLRGVEDSRCLCEQMSEEARGTKKDGKPYSFPLRPSKCLFSLECAQAIEEMGDKFRG
jgi:hypothetical protein